MAFQVQCPKCKQLLRVEEKFRGKVVKCPKCNTNMKVAGTTPSGEAGQVEQTAESLVGKQIAHYRILSLLGEGGMGRVYKAHNLRRDTSCALKILPPKFARQDETRIRRFIREGRSAARIQHPNVLSVYFVGKVKDNYFIEMQYVNGGPLDEVLSERGRLEPSEAARIIRDVASGLQAAHDQGITHRDIKPSNIMLTRRGTVLVADFGVAKTSGMTISLTMTGMVVGTPLYMSPEQVRGEKADHRSDIYALGAMFYQLLTGTTPYMDETVAAIMRHHISTPVPDMRQFVPSTPPALVEIVARMMAKEREARYQNCSELVADLNRYLGIPTPPTATRVKKAIPIRKAGRKKRWLVPLIVGLIVAFIAVGAALALFIIRGRGSP